MSPLTFFAYAALVYAAGIYAAIAWARHCRRRPRPEIDPHTHMNEVPHHAPPL